MQRAGNLIRNKMSQHTRLCIFKMLTPKKGEQETFPCRFWIPDIDPQRLVCYTSYPCVHFLKHTHNEWIPITGEEVVLIWSNVDIFAFFPHEVLAPFRAFQTLSNFPVTSFYCDNSCRVHDSSRVIIGYKHNLFTLITVQTTCILTKLVV